MDITSDAVLSEFAVVLGVQPGDRKLAEQRLKALEAVDSFPVILVDLLVNNDVALNFRQLAAITLEHYVSAHWDGEQTAADATSQLGPSSETKTYVRSKLLRVLQTDDRRVRTVVAHLIYVVAQFDWPDAWPSLMSELAHMLASVFNQGDMKLEQQKAIVHGALCVLSHLSGEMSDLDVPRVVPVVMPPLVRILCEEQSFGYSVRKNVASVISNFVNVLIEEIFCENVGTYIGPCINQLLNDLSRSDLPMVASSFETEVLQLLTLLCTTAPKFVTKNITGGVPRLIAVSCQLLLRVSETYTRMSINPSGFLAQDSDQVDSDGESVDYTYLVYALLEHFTCLVSTRRFRNRLESHLEEIFYRLFLMSQLPNATLEKAVDIDEFLEEHEGALSCTVRQTTLDLIRTCADTLSNFDMAFTRAVCRILSNAENLHSQSDPNWWKLLEAGLFLCGTFPTSFTPSNGSISHDVLKSRYLEPSWQQSDLPFLQVSALQCATQFSVNDIPAGPSLDALPLLLINSLAENQHAILRVSAVSAVSDACSRFRQVCSNPSSPDLKATIVSHLPELVNGVVQCMATFGETVLDNGLYSLQGLLRIDPQCFGSSSLTQLTNIILDLFKHCVSVASTLSVYLDVLRALQQTGNAAIVEEAFMPVLLNCLEQDLKAVESVAIEASLQVLSVIIRGSPLPLSPILIQRAFPAVVHLAIIGEDALLLTTCCEVLRSYLATDVNSVLNWQDDEGNNGIGYILHVASRLLDPSAPVEWAVVAGRLVCAILLRLKAEQLGENTDLLLRGTLVRLSALPMDLTVTCRDAQKSLLFVFVVLCRMCPLVAIDFLSSVPDLSGKPAIEKVMRLWCECQLLFVSQHEVRISIQAMSNLLVHTITSQDNRLMLITAEEVIDSDEVHSCVADRTRQKQTQNRIQIPLLVKMYKLLVYELAKTMEDEDEDDSEEEDDDDDGDDRAEVDVTVQEPAVELTDIQQTKRVEESEGEDDDDPLELDDPIYSDDSSLKIDIKEHLCNLFRELVQQPFYNEFSRYHTQTELATLQQAEILQLS